MRIQSLRRHRGIFLLDLMTAIILLTALATVLLVGMTKTAAARDRLANDREAMEAAQRTLFALSQHQPQPKMDERTSAKVEPMPDGWIKVTANVEGRSATLIGFAAGGGK